MTIKPYVPHVITEEELAAMPPADAIELHDAYDMVHNAGTDVALLAIAEHCGTRSGLQVTKP